MLIESGRRLSIPVTSSGVGLAARMAQRNRPPYLLVLAAFGVLTVVLTTAITLAADPPVHPWIQTGPAWLDSWFQFDSGWYYSIVVDGYSFNPDAHSSAAFFPTYPMLVRALALPIGDAQIAGTVLSLVAGATATCLFARWVWDRVPRTVALVAIALVLLYPYAFFLHGAMYSDAVILLVVLASFLLLEQRMYWAAGLVGILATAGRPFGIALTVGLVIRMLEMQVQARRAASDDPDDRAAPASPVRFREILGAIRTVRWRQAGVLASVLGLVGWCLYLLIEFGHPLAWLQAQAAWDQASGPYTWFKITYFQLIGSGNLITAFLLTAQLGMCVLALLLLPRVHRMYGWGYLAFCVVALAIPIIGTKDFYGTGRYVLMAFPVIAAGAAWLVSRRQRWWVPATLSVFAVGLLGATCLFGMGVPVA